jgi:hypothetical protein
MSLLWARFYKWILGAVAVLAAVASVYFKGRSAGKQVEQKKATQRDLTEAKEHAETIRETAMLSRTLFVCLIPLFASACGNLPATIDTACSWVRVITISKDDVLTDDTARQILIHDEQVERVCNK